MGCAQLLAEFRGRQWESVEAIVSRRARLLCSQRKGF